MSGPLQAAGRSTDRAATAWTTALDEFEQRLVQYRMVLADNMQPAVGIWPPAYLIDLALPAEHADRARELLAMARELEAELVARRDQLPTPRAAGRQRRTPPVSSFLTDL